MAEIHKLVEKNDLAGLKEFLELNLGDVNAKDPDGNTALHLAAAGFDSSAEVIKLLLDAGADVKIVDSEGQTPLHLASGTQGKTEVVKLLLDAGADVKIVDSKGRTPLHHSVGLYAGDEEVVKLLRAAGADVNGVDLEGKTPLHYAVDSSLQKHAGALLAKDANANGADINAKDLEGNTPLHLAVQNQDGEMVKGLVFSGADLEVKNNIGKTPVQMDLENSTKFFESSESSSLPEFPPLPALPPKQTTSLPQNFNAHPFGSLNLGGILSASAQPGYGANNASQRIKDAEVLKLLKNNPDKFGDVVSYISDDPVINELKAVHDAGITKIYSLAHEHDDRNPELLKQLFEGMFPGSQYITKIDNTEIAIEDYHAPTGEQLDCITSSVAGDLKSGQNVLVHCGYGQGRTGTALAAILMEATQNYNVDNAIQHVRDNYLSGAVEKDAQKDALKQFARTRGDEGVELASSSSTRSVSPPPPPKTKIIVDGGAHAVGDLPQKARAELATIVSNVAAHDPHASPMHSNAHPVIDPQKSFKR